jgi:TetR/AcrR family transcriptional regulator
LIRAKLRAAVERTRRRQRDGEITGDVQAEFILLLAHMLAFAPLAMPQIVEALLGLDPLSPEYRRRCLEQLLTLVQPARRPLPGKPGADHE